MALEEIKAEIALLLAQMENQPQDKHELYLQLREKMHELEAFGMPMPEDMRQLMSGLEAEFSGAAKPSASRR